MTEPRLAGKAPAAIRVDQFVAAPPAKVWRLLTEPELVRLWWAELRLYLHRGLDADLAPGAGRYRHSSVLGAQRF